MTLCVSIMFNMNVSFVLKKNDVFKRLYKIILEIESYGHGSWNLKNLRVFSWTNRYLMRGYVMLINVFIHFYLFFHLHVRMQILQSKLL